MKKVVTRIWAFLLAVSFIFNDALPTFAAGILKMPTAGEMQGMWQGQVTSSDGQEDGMVYMDGALYTGYYMDKKNKSKKLLNPKCESE